MVGFLVVLIVAGFFFMRSEKVSSQTANGGELEGDVQKVVISIRDFNYYPQEVRVKAGEPVAIYLDNKVGGCFRDFTIPELGLHEYLATSEDALVFTPTQKGRYTFACSMRMGTGTLIVE